MSVLPIVQWPDARLSEACAEVGSRDVSELVSNMFDTMYGAPGRGLAAPQVGVLLRLFVMDAGWKDGARTPLVMLDPVIEPFGEDVLITEACLSVPAVEVAVTRPAQVRASWTDLIGQSCQAEFDGAEARIIQHEFDHLNGKLHFDRVATAERATLETPYLEDRA